MLTNFINIERIIHSTKTAIACIIGFLFTRIIGLPADQWVVITIIVVMCAQIYVGSVLQKAWLRFLGTLIGCIFAALAIVIAGVTDINIAVTIGLSSFVFSYLATKGENLTYAGTLGAVTTAIIMLGQKPTVIFAIERFLEISLGILIATLVSQFILPINARTHLRRAQAETLEQLRDYYILVLTEIQPDTIEPQELDETIVKSLLKQRQLANESARERIGSAFDRVHFMQSLSYERDILRAITFMHNAKSYVKNAAAIFINSPAAHVFNETILQTLDTLIKAIKKEDSAKEHIHVPSLEGLKTELQKSMAAPTREDLIYIDGFLYCAEILTQSLAKLAALYNVPIYEAEKKIDVHDGSR